jgi:hypothetical protein
MSSTFQHYGVWSSMLKEIPVKDYVRTSRIKIDCAYMTVPSSAEESRQFKMFHALDVETERDRVTELVQTYPEFGKRLREDRDARPVLNVICGDSTSTANQIYTQPYDELHEAGINTYRIRDLAMLAATARQDLHMRPL